MNQLSSYAGYFDENLFNEEGLICYTELANSSLEMMNSHLMSLEQILYCSSNHFSNDYSLLKDIVPSPYSFGWSNIPSINSDSKIFDSSYLNKYGSKSSEEISSHENEQHIEQAQPQSDASQQSNNGAQADESEADLKIRAEQVPILNKSGTIRKRIGGKHIETGMTKRRDVVLKSLLRKIRKYIRRNFFQNYRCLTNMHYKNIEILKRHLKSYINKYIQEDPSDSFVEMFGVFICTEQMECFMRRISGHEEKKILNDRITKVRDALCKFSYARYVKLLKFTGMCDVILHFRNTQSFRLLNNDELIGFKVFSDECNKQLNLNLIDI